MTVNGNNCKLCKISFFRFICSPKFCLEDKIFKFIGVYPYDREFRDNIDWLYLILWASSIAYQLLLFICFFYYPDSRIFITQLEDLFEPYLMAVTGYGVFNVLYRYRPKNSRYHQIDVGEDRRKERNGHRFIRYWWLNFAIMFLATIFLGYDELDKNLSAGPLRISKKIAIACTAIGFGYWMAKNKWNGLHRKDSANPILWLLGINRQ